MASSLAEAIKKELECSICLKIIDTPKILESCSHVFCKKCISDLVKSNEETSCFACPECRAECKLPAEGVDGLKDDIKLASLIKTLNASEKTVLPCCLCQNVKADSVCDFCDLDLCPKCRKAHLIETKQTGDHIVYDLCVKHKRRKKHYCCKCDALICVECLRANHSDENHDTKPYKDFVTAQLKSLEKQTKKISNTAKLTADQITKANEHVAGAKRKVKTKKKGILEQFNAAIIPLTIQISEVKQEIEKFQIRLEQLESKKAAHLQYMEAKIRAIDSEKIDSSEIEQHKLVMAEKIKQIDLTKKQLKRLKEKYWLGVGHHQQITDCKCKMGEIVSTLGDLEETIGNIERVCHLVEADVQVTPEVDTSAKHVLTFAEVAELNVGILAPTSSTNNTPSSSPSTWVSQLVEAVDDAKVMPTPEVDTSSKHVLTFAEVAEVNVDIPAPTSSTNDTPSSSPSTWVSQLVEAVDDAKVMPTPEVDTSSKHVLTFAEVAEVNVDIPAHTSSTNDTPLSSQSTWAPMQEWNFDTNGPCCIYSVVSLPKGLAILGCSSDIQDSKIFYFPSSIKNVFAVVLQGVSPSKDMTVNSAGNLVLLRAEKPYLRVYLEIWNYQWSNDVPSPEEITNPRNIACAGDKMIILNGVHPNVTLFVLNPKGEVLHCLQMSHFGRLAYSDLTQMVYISVPGSETFKLNVTVLSPTGTKLELPAGLHARDIGCREDGIVAVAGITSSSNDTPGRAIVCLLNNANLKQTLVDIVDGSGQPVLVNGKAARIRMDIREKILIIACGAKLLFYQMA